MPIVEPLPETQATQEKKGVSITLAPIPFEIRREPSCSYGLMTRSTFLVPTNVNRNTHVRVDETRYSAPVITPTDLSFLLTIRNRMNRVFRGAGAVIQFNVGGRIQGIDQSRYSDVLGALIPPQSQVEIRLSGPSVDALTSNSGSPTLGVFLSDIVTEIDNAGTITARDNFEWFYTATTKTISERVPFSSRRVWIPNEAARGIMRTTEAGGMAIIEREKATCVEGAIAG